MSPAAWLWTASAALFLAGLFCLVLRRELIIMLLGLELMINAANINIVHFAASQQDPKAMALAFLVIAVAAAEAVVGLSLILALDQSGVSADSDSIKELAG